MLGGSYACESVRGVSERQKVLNVRVREYLRMRRFGVGVVTRH